MPNLHKISIPIQLGPGTSHNIGAQAPPIQRWPATFQCLPPGIRPHHPGAPGEWNGSTGLRVPGTAELPNCHGMMGYTVATQIQRWVLGEKINPDRDQLQVTFKKNYSKIFKGYFGRQDFKMKHLMMCNYFDHADPIK